MQVLATTDSEQLIRTLYVEEDFHDVCTITQDYTRVKLLLAYFVGTDKLPIKFNGCKAELYTESGATYGYRIGDLYSPVSAREALELELNNWFAPIAERVRSAMRHFSEHRVLEQIQKGMAVG